MVQVLSKAVQLLVKKQLSIERISKFADFFLVPLTKQQETYIRDSSALINKLETIRHPTDCLIASFDIRQMYTNLEINEMVEAVGRAWDQLNSTDYNIKVPNKNTIEILTRFILENNYFTFNNKYYRQVIQEQAWAESAALEWLT